MKGCLSREEKFLNVCFNLFCLHSCDPWDYWVSAAKIEITTRGRRGSNQIVKSSFKENLKHRKHLQHTTKGDEHVVFHSQIHQRSNEKSMLFWFTRWNYNNWVEQKLTPARFSGWSLGFRVRWWVRTFSDLDSLFVAETQRKQLSPLTQPTLR